MSNANKELSLFDIDVTSWDERVSSMIHSYQKNELVVDVDCQRGFVWKQKHSSRLIESIMMGLPIPIFYCFEADLASELIDGKQRFLSIYKFVNNEYKLKGMEVYSQYNGFYFKDLPTKVQREINNYALHVYKIRSDDEESKYEIFNRLNTGGAKLKFEELVLGMHEGSITNFAKLVSRDLINEGVVSESSNKHKRIDVSVLTHSIYTRESLVSTVGKSKKTEVASVFKDESWKEVFSEPNVQEFSKLLKASFELGRNIREDAWPSNNAGRDNVSLTSMMVYMLSRIPLSVRYQGDVLGRIRSEVGDAVKADDGLLDSFQLNTCKKEHRMMRQVVADRILAQL